MQEQLVPNQPAKSQNTASLTNSPTPDQTVENQDTAAAAEKALLSQMSQRPLAMVAGLILMLCLSLWGMYSLNPSDPYTQSVLQLAGNVPRGHEIFQLNCATCHGLEAAGEVGPTLQDISERRSRVSLIQQVISGQTPPMPQFQPNERDMADLLSFLETL